MSSIVQHADEPRPPRLVRVPKPGGGHRLLTVLDSRDAARYADLVARVSGLVEQGLGPEVMANRVADGAALRPFPPAWREFVRARRALARRGSHLLHVDVRRCYPSITPGAVDGALRSLGADGSVVRPVTVLLERFAGDGVPGLPIGPDPSAILANAVLTAADDAIRGTGAPHLRWVDDVWVSGSEDRLERVLERLRAALGRIGLEVNEEKTTVIEASDTLLTERGKAPSGGL